jgi:hypothetical protein
MKINLFYSIVHYNIILYIHVNIQTHNSIASAKKYSNNDFINHRSRSKRKHTYDVVEQDENSVNRRRRRRRWEASESESCNYFRSLSEYEEEENIIEALSIAQICDDETYHYYHGFGDYDDYYDDVIHNIYEDYDEQEYRYESFAHEEHDITTKTQPNGYVSLSQKKLKLLEKKEHDGSTDKYNIYNVTSEVGVVGSIQNNTVKINNNIEGEIIEKSYDQTKMEVTSTNSEATTTQHEVQTKIDFKQEINNQSNVLNVRKLDVKTTHSFFPPKLSQRRKFYHISTKSNNNKMPPKVSEPTDAQESTSSSYPTMRNKIPIEIPSSIDAIRERAKINARNKKTKSSPTNTSDNRFAFLTQQEQQQQNAQKSVSMTTNHSSHQSQQGGNKVNSPSSTTTTSPNTISSSINTSLPNHNPQQRLQKSSNELKTPNNRKLPTTMSLTTPWARKFILSRPKDALLPIPRDFLTDGFNLVQLAPVVERLVTHDKNNRVHLQHGHNSHYGKHDSSSPSLYKAALRLILDDNESNINAAMNVTKHNHSNRTSAIATNPTPSASTHPQHNPALVQKAAELLYTLVHSRYVNSPRGLDTIRRMFLRNYEIGTKEVVFGKCPRVCCNGNPLLPYGRSCEYYFEYGEKGGAVASSIVNIQRKSMRYCCSCGEVSSDKLL